MCVRIYAVEVCACVSVYAGVLGHVSRIVACRYSRAILIIRFVHACEVGVVVVEVGWLRYE